MLAFQERLTLYCGVTPTPASDSVVFVIEALLLSVNVPESVPLVVGVKTT